MAGLGRAIMVLGAVSVIGTATQLAKGKLGAVFLTASGVGVLSQLTLLYGLLFILAGLGFFNGIMRQITVAVKDGDNRLARAQMNSVTLFLGTSSVLLSALCLSQAAYLSDLLFDDGGARADLVSVVVLAVPIAVQQRIFRAYLNATRDLKAIYRAQSGADIASVAIFAIGAWQFGIIGAAIAFVAMHVLLLLGVLGFSVRTGGLGLVLPNPRNFRWQEIIPNFGYGINGLVMTATASASAIIIGRMVISVGDLSQAGIFSVAWKVSTVYLGALYAAAGSYYFPTLIGLNRIGEVESEANGAVALYMMILPPIIAGLIIFDGLLISTLFSPEFLPATIVMAGLLFGDLFRVTGETMGLTLLARKRLVSYTGVYLIYAGGFVSLSAWTLPKFGLMGIAISYIFMQLINLSLTLSACHFLLGVRMTRTALRPFLLALCGIAPLVAAEFAGLGTGPKFTIGVASGLIWLGANWRTPELTQLRTQLLNRIKAT